MDEFDRNAQQTPCRGDAEDMAELQQIMANQHNILYHDYSPFQEVLVVESKNLRMYLNKQLQFSSLDERIYHEALVHPAMQLAKKHDRVLIVSGNDGLILREVLKYKDVKRVCLVDIDFKLLHMLQKTPEIVSLNEGAFSDDRVHLHKDFAKFLSGKRKKYDVIIVDYLDPADPLISVKYRRKIFRRLSRHLARNGVMVCQAHSPQDAPLVFWSIGLTLESAGLQTLSYHVNVPTFGDWGFHLAAKRPLVWRNNKVQIANQTLPEDFTGWFEFSPAVLELKKQAMPNTKHNLILHKFYSQSVLRPDSGYPLTKEDNLAELPRLKGHRRQRKLANYQKIYGDADDLVELRQLLDGPHRLLVNSRSKEHEILLIEGEEVRMYLDKQLQLSSLDENIYHEALVHPALTLAPKHKRILIVGGGDGMALREVLKYQDVDYVDLVEIDPIVLHAAGSVPSMLALNGDALHDPRVCVNQCDAQDFIVEPREPYDVIIVDFPDPADEVISTLYTTEFFNCLTNSLTGDGILACQSHSPTDAPLVFWSIAQTLRASALATLSYHLTVPSFGDWGFHLASKKTIEYSDQMVLVPVKTLPADWHILCEFPPEVLAVKALAQVNSQEHLVLHKIYEKEVGFN